MRKLTSILLILLIGLTFSNIASAGLFGIDGLFSKDNIRCKITYTKLDLNTGLEEENSITTQFVPTPSIFMCTQGIDIIAAKITKFIDEGGNNNVLVNLSGMSCKKRESSWGLWHNWTGYYDCLKEDNAPMIGILQLNNNFGYNVNSSRLLTNY
jgi:hypothetical protein